MVKSHVRLIAISIVILGSIGVAAAVPAPPKIDIRDRKFDHAAHAVAASKASQGVRRNAACVDCHQMDGKGVRKAGKEHGHRCVKCHQDPATCTPAMKKAGPESPGRRCVVCHVMERCKPPDLPAAPSHNTFQAGFSHGKHIGFGAAIEKECGTCHTDQAPAAGVAGAKVAGGGHALCQDCHRVGGRSKLVMTNCEGCHQPWKPQGGPSGDPFQLVGFDHRKHHAKSNQASCTTCHKKMTGNDRDSLPRPDMLGCVSACHDGQKAWSAVGTKCTTCHTSGSSQTPAPNRADMMFSHSAHAARNVVIARCDSCHSLTPEGMIEPPGKGKNHAPCANSGCHQAEYASKTTKICGACHDQSAPWQKAVARGREPIKEEWFETINHASHLAKKGQTNSSCGDCHGDKLGGGKKPNDHAACAQCHGKGAPAHPMTDCAKCHLNQKPQKAGASEWSVAATFVHEKHATDPRTKKTTECAGCHAEVKNAKDLASIKKPTMESCGRCHDGKLTFKTTGYECAKCHTKGGAAPAVSSVGTGKGLALVLPVSVPAAVFGGSSR